MSQFTLAQWIWDYTSTNTHTQVYSFYKIKDVSKKASSVLKVYIFINAFLFIYHRLIWNTMLIFISLALYCLINNNLTKANMKWKPQVTIDKISTYFMFVKLLLNLCDPKHVRSITISWMYYSINNRFLFCNYFLCFQ